MKNSWIQTRTDAVARHLEIDRQHPITCKEFKTYGKAAFTPLVPAQVLRKGRLVDAPATAD